MLRFISSVVFSCVVSLIFGVGNAQADERYVSERMLCGDGSMVLQFTRDYNRTPTFLDIPAAFSEDFQNAKPAKDLTCNFGSPSRSNEIKVKFGTIPARPWGACGGQTKYFFSMWINERRIVSRQFYDNACTQFDSLDMVVYKDGTLLFCTRPNASQSGFLNPVGMATKFNIGCVNMTDLMRLAMQGPKDHVQYPFSGKRIEGKVVLTMSRNPEMCSYFLSAFQGGKTEFTVFDDNTSTQPLDRPWLVNTFLTKSFDVVKMDINNDGNADFVSAAPSGFHHEGQDLVLVMDGRTTREKDPEPKIDFESLRSLDPLIPVEKTVFANRDAPSRQPPVFGLPFRWKSRSYVLLKPALGLHRQVWAVYEFTDSYDAAAVCVFDKEPIHY